MKRISIISLLIISVSCFSSCIVQSIHPFYTADAVVEPPMKNGEWTMIDSNGVPVMPKPWVFNGDEITTYDARGARAVVKVTYFKVKQTIFMDAVADKPQKGVCTWWAMQLTPVHTLCRIEIKKDSMTFFPINYEWFVKALKDKIVILPHEESKGNDFLVFTASSRQWMDFLAKHGKDKRVFSETFLMKFVMKKIQPKKTSGIDNSVKTDKQ